jgi:hypothetical protein
MPGRCNRKSRHETRRPGRRDAPKRGGEEVVVRWFDCARKDRPAFAPYANRLLGTMPGGGDSRL